jgi:hypothetical protein
MITRSRYETVETVIDNMILYISLTTKNSFGVRQRVTRMIEKEGHLFVEIDKFCQRLSIPSKIFFDVMFSEPLGPSRNWSYPYLSFLGNATAQTVFLARIDAYKKRLGSFDNVLEYVESKSIANLGAYFGDSFEQGYWSVHRALDSKSSTEDFTLDELFTDLFMDPVFTYMFVTTHPLWEKFCYHRRNDEVVQEMKQEFKGELGVLADNDLMKKFQAVRNTMRNSAQKSLTPRKDERWQRIWKVMG